MDINKVKQNDTLRFLVPVLNEFEATDDLIITPNFKGAYIKDNEHPEYDDCLLLQYETVESDAYTNAKVFLESLPYYENVYSKDAYTIYVLKVISEFFNKSLEAFKKGKFTEFSTAQKHFIVSFWGLELLEGNDPLTGILNATELGKEIVYSKLSETLKNNTAENEIWPIPNMVRETL